MGKHFVLATMLGLLTLMELSPLPARADSFADCTQSRDLDRSIRGCTDLLNAGQLNGENKAAIYNNRGTAYKQKGLYERAIADYTSAIRLDPRDTVTYINRGHAYAMKDQYDRAIADFTMAIKIDSLNADAYYDRGIAYKRNGQYDRAIADFSKAIELDPGYVDAYVNRGNAYHKKGQNEQAIINFRRALELDPSDEQIRMALKELGVKP